MTTEPLRHISQTEIGPRPTAEQEARLQARRRFNRLTIHLPLGLVTFLWLVLIVGLLWLTVAGKWFYMDTNQEYYRSLVSGMADAFTVLLLMPVMLLCALPLAGAGAFLIWRRRRRKPDGDDDGKLPLFWRVDNLLTRIQTAVSAALPKMAGPIINVHGAAAYIRTLLQEIKKTIGRR
ncbi:MAG: hypothetical protein RRC07_07380 [Anaerolineae bacterium]|nr:hypothetical protein [Anaerolineae bacterium]